MVLLRSVDAHNDDPNQFCVVISSTDAVYQRPSQTYQTSFGIIRDDL